MFGEQREKVPENSAVFKGPDSKASRRRGKGKLSPNCNYLSHGNWGSGVTSRKRKRQGRKKEMGLKEGERTPGQRKEAHLKNRLTTENLLNFTKQGEGSSAEGTWRIKFSKKTGIS